MLKNTPPAAACTNKSSSTCMKSVITSTGKTTVNSVKSSVPVITKNVTHNPNCIKNATAGATTKSAPVTCTKNTNSANCHQQNGTCIKNASTNVARSTTITTTNNNASSTAKPVLNTAPASNPAKCSNAKTPIPSVMRSMAASNQTASTNASTTTTNGTATTTTCPNGNSAPAANSELRIIIIDENWSQYCYRIKINTPFGKLINRFCQQVRKIDHKSVLFWYHGRLVEDDDTPKTLNIKDGEVILAHYIK